MPYLVYYGQNTTGILIKLNMVKNDITHSNTRTTISNSGMTQSKESFGGRSPRYIAYLLEFVGGNCGGAVSDPHIESPVRSLAYGLNNGNRVIGVFRPPDVFSRLDFHVSTKDNFDNYFHSTYFGLLEIQPTLRLCYLAWICFFHASSNTR